MTDPRGNVACGPGRGCHTPRALEPGGREYARGTARDPTRRNHVEGVHERRPARVTLAGVPRDDQALTEAPPACAGSDGLVHGSSYASAMAEGDFNGDGRLDLAVSNGGPSPNVSVLLGQGDGNFRAAPSVGAGGRGPFAVAVVTSTATASCDLAVPQNSASGRPRGPSTWWKV